MQNCIKQFFTLIIIAENKCFVKLYAHVMNQVTDLARSTILPTDIWVAGEMHQLWSDCSESKQAAAQV